MGAEKTHRDHPALRPSPPQAVGARDGIDKSRLYPRKNTDECLRATRGWVGCAGLPAAAREKGESPTRPSIYLLTLHEGKLFTFAELFPAPAPKKAAAAAVAKTRCCWWKRRRDVNARQSPPKKHRRDESVCPTVEQAAYHTLARFLLRARRAQRRRRGSGPVPSFTFWVGSGRGTESSQEK